MSEQFNEIFDELESWYGQEHGKYALQQTRERLQAHLDTAFGYHILQVGPLRNSRLTTDSRINHQIYAGPRSGPGVGLLCESHELPLDSDSVDVIVAHHCIEFSDNPHQVLRELQRVLTPQGQLLLVGFNPLSIRGLYTGARGLLRRSPWHNHHRVGERRLNDWLRLVGCVPTSRSFVYSIPQVGGGKLRNMLEKCDSWCSAHNLPIGGLYVVHAIKQVSAHNRPRLGLRRRSEQLIGLAVPKAGPAASPAPATPARGRGTVGANRQTTGDNNE
jgi:SAM-dependent methyltransferase